MTEHRDIFAAKPVPLPRNRAPSLRYDLFIKALEREVVAAQARIEQMRGMERLYNLVKEVLERVKLPNDTALSLGSHNARVEITALPTDSTATFAPVVDGVGKALVAAGFRTDPEPTCRDGGYWHQLIRTWHVGERMVQVTINLPETDGLVDLEVICTERHATSLEYSVRKREPKAISHAPPHIVPEEIVF